MVCMCVEALPSSHNELQWGKEHSFDTTMVDFYPILGTVVWKWLTLKY